MKEIIEANLEIRPKFFWNFRIKTKEYLFQIGPPFSHGPMGFIPTWWPPIRGIYMGIYRQCDGVSFRRIDEKADS